MYQVVDGVLWFDLGAVHQGLRERVYHSLHQVVPQRKSMSFHYSFLLALHYSQILLLSNNITEFNILTVMICPLPPPPTPNSPTVHTGPSSQPGQLYFFVSSQQTLEPASVSSLLRSLCPPPPAPLGSGHSSEGSPPDLWSSSWHFCTLDQLRWPLRIKK